MWQEDRQQKIRELLTAYGRVSTDRVSREFEVARETIRRDLVEMEQAGELRRVRGGAVPATPKSASFQVRHTQHRQEKQAIAARALQFLENGMTIFMDAGSTTSVMSEALSGYNGLVDLTVITNSVNVARHLSDASGKRLRGFRVLMLGGEFRQDPMETFGAVTINEIHRYHADVAMVVPWGVDGLKGASDYHLYGAEVARAMVHNAQQTIILADHSKIGAPSRSVFCPPGEIDVLITDAGARGLSAFESLRQSVSKVVVAE